MKDREIDRKKAPLGSGERFQALTKQLSSRAGVTDAPALAAYIARKKYGKSRFQAMAAAGRKGA